MSGWAFIPIKGGDPWPESVEQPESGLAILLKILRIGRAEHPRPLVQGGTAANRNFVRILNDMANLPQMGRFVI
jgi:hypothetical protein